MWDIDPRAFSVVLVDDDEPVLRAMFRDIRDAGFNALAFADSRAAKAFLAEVAEERRPSGSAATLESVEPGWEARAIDAIISDVKMPNFSGIDLLEHARTALPDAMRFVLTGYADIHQAVEAINRAGAHYYFVKPWNAEDIQVHLNNALVLRRTRREAEAARRMNLANLHAFEDDVIRISNEFKGELHRYLGEDLPSVLDAVKNLGERIEILGRGAGGASDAYYMLKPVKDAAEEGIAPLARFGEFLDSKIAAELSGLINCASFLIAMAGEDRGVVLGRFRYEEFIESALREMRDELRRTNVRIEARLPMDGAQIWGSAAMVEQAWKILLTFVAELLPDGGDVLLAPPANLSEDLIAHSAISAFSPKTHVILSIKGAIGVPDGVYGTIVGGLEAKMVEETFRFHGGAAAFLNRHESFDFVLAIQKK